MNLSWTTIRMTSYRTKRFRITTIWCIRWHRIRTNQTQCPIRYQAASHHTQRPAHVRVHRDAWTQISKHWIANWMLSTPKCHWLTQKLHKVLNNWKRLFHANDHDPKKTMTDWCVKLYQHSHITCQVRVCSLVLTTVRCSCHPIQSVSKAIPHPSQIHPVWVCPVPICLTLNSITITIKTTKNSRSLWMHYVWAAHHNQATERATIHAVRRQWWVKTVVFFTI